MPERLRQPRHSRVSECLCELAGARAVVRVALLCALALLGGGCPAVLDLESEPIPEGADADPPEHETETEPSVVDAATTRVNSISPRPEEAAPCRHVPAQVPDDAGRPGTAAEPGQVHAAGATSGPELALRAVVAAGYVLPCGGEHTHVLLLPDGYELSALGHAGRCPPFETMLYRLRVSKSGQISVLDAVTFNPAQLGCAAGEPQLTQEPTAPPLA
jgi:hypothetical protein